MAAPTFPSEMLGGCRCSRIRYRVTGTPKFVFACHCTDCQHFTSSAFSLGMPVDDKQFALTAGVPHEWTRTAESGKQSTRYTCPGCACWTHTRTESQPDITVVRPMTLDEHAWVRPLAQIFTKSALSWALMPLHFTFTEEFDDPETLAKAFALGGIGPKAT